MAVSDPTTGVPTPTGALQGVAAASWDGSAWQPAGRTGPSVATPTGVLQGVAPFTWDGSAWQPSGRAAPGVATPTGGLDGVAVYTWSGSAWTPAGGTATPSTPTGALRGVAAFSWDGAAWQPAAQAGPSVPTPTGVLQGVAMFNWNGTAWQPGGALPSGATLDLSFLTAGALDPRITFTRASTATYFDAAGVLQTAATNTPRWDYDPVTHALRGLLIEEARTNVLLNSGRLDNVSWTATNLTVTATATSAPDGTTNAIKGTPVVAVGTHIITPSPSAITAGSTNTFSLFAKAAGYPRVYLQFTNGAQTNGAGATFNLTTGTASAINYIGLGSGGSVGMTNIGNGWYRCAISVMFDGTSSATSAITFVDNGTTVNFGGDGTSGLYLWGGQIETGAFATSYIPTTAASVTRAAEACSMPTAAWFNASTSSLVADCMVQQSPNPSATLVRDACALSDVSANNRLMLRAQIISAATAAFGTSVAGTTTASGSLGATTANASAKVGAAWSGTTGVGSLNGGATVSYAVGMPAGLTTLTLGNDYSGATAYLNGWVRRVRYWPRVLSNAELQSVTT